MQRTVHDYLKALEAGDADKAASLFIAMAGWSRRSWPTAGTAVHQEGCGGVEGNQAHRARRTREREGHLRAVAYYLYDWRLTDGSRVSFDCADVFNFDPSSGRIQSIVLVYDTHPVRGVVESKYP